MRINACPPSCHLLLSFTSLYSLHIARLYTCFTNISFKSISQVHTANQPRCLRPPPFPPLHRQPKSRASLLAQGWVRSTRGIAITTRSCRVSMPTHHIKAATDCPLTEIAWEPTTEVDPAVREAALRPLKHTGNLKDDWMHLRRRWKIVIIVSCAGMLILGLLSVLLPYFVPQGSMHQHVSNKVLHATAPVGTWKGAVKPRFWSQSSQAAPSSPRTPSIPEGTVVLVPVSFKA